MPCAARPGQDVEVLQVGALGAVLGVVGGIEQRVAEQPAGVVGNQRAKARVGAEAEVAERLDREPARRIAVLAVEAVHQADHRLGIGGQRRADRPRHQSTNRPRRTAVRPGPSRRDGMISTHWS